MPNKLPISITLDADLLDWLRARAAEERLTLSAYLNQRLHIVRDVDERRRAYDYGPDGPPE